MENKYTREKLKEYLKLSSFDLKKYTIVEIEDYPSGLELIDSKGRKIVIYNDYLVNKIRIVYVEIKKDDDFTNIAIRLFLADFYNMKAKDLRKKIRIETEEIGPDYIRYVTKLKGKTIKVSPKFHVDTDVYDIYEYFKNETRELEAS